MHEKTIFQKIIDREEPAEFLFENDDFIIIKNKFPDAPTHCLVIPKKLIPSIGDITETDRELIGNLFLVAKEFIKENGIINYRLIFNGGKYLHVNHLHLHILSGEDLKDETI